MSRKKNPEVLRFTAATIGTITAIGYGAAMTWTSPSIPYLTSEKSSMRLTKEQSDIISSLLTVGYITGYLMNPFVIERFGSKRTLLIYTIPQIASWLLINISKVPITLYVARIFAGMGYGAAICALTIYLSEIGTSETRGIFISFLNLSMGFGFFLVMLLGAYVPYNYMNSILLVFPIIFLITFFFMPDSSYFSKQREEIKDQEMKVRLKSSEDCDKEELRNVEIGDLYFKKDYCSKENFYEKDVSLKGCFIRKEGFDGEIGPKKEDTNKDFGPIQDFDPNLDSDQNKLSEEDNSEKEGQNFYLKEDHTLNKEEPNLKTSLMHNREKILESEEEKADKDSKQKEEKSGFFNIKESRFWKMISCRNSRKALIITVSLASQDVLSGHMVVWTYTQQLLTNKGSPIDSEKATMFLAVAKIVASGLSAQIIEKTGRRNILLVTSIMGTIANILVCGFFFMEEANFDISSFGWLPCVGLTTYEFSLSLGCANFFYLYQAELFTPEIKSMGVMVCKVTYMALSYFCLFRYQVLTAAFGKAIIYLFFCIFSVLTSVFVLSITPETRGKSNEEIQVILRKKFFVL